MSSSKLINWTVDKNRQSYVENSAYWTAGKYHLLDRWRIPLVGPLESTACWTAGEYHLLGRWRITLVGLLENNACWTAGEYRLLDHWSSKVIKNK